MNAEDHEFLSQVEAGTPLGDYLRSHWVPVMRAARVEAGGAPIRARLFGENYVVFRAVDGRVGVIDEACPHRGASMALGRVEGCALRCLYHGWEVDVSGASVHAVSEANGKERGPDLALRPYPVREVGKMIWAYFGTRDVAPQFPDYEWTRLDNATPNGAIVHCNWLQAVEGAIDPVHVGFLHPHWLPEFAVKMMQKTSIQFEVDDKPYGFSGVTVRSLPGMPGMARIKEIALPYYCHVPFEPLENRFVVFAVPIDRTTCYLWYISYYADDPVPDNVPKRSTGVTGSLNGKPADVPEWQYGVDHRLTQAPNPDNFRETMPFDSERLWNQDRAAILEGKHFTGLPGITTEDIAILESQGAIQDRTKERLSRGDALIVRLRRMLMERAKELAAGVDHQAEAIDYGTIRSRMGFLKEGQTWQDVPKYSWEIPNANVERPIQKVAAE